MKIQVSLLILFGLFGLGTSIFCYTCGSILNGFMCNRDENGIWENGKLGFCNGTCYSMALGKPNFSYLLQKLLTFLTVGTVGNATGLDLRFKGCDPALDSPGCDSLLIPELVNFH